MLPLISLVRKSQEWRLSDFRKFKPFHPISEGDTIASKGGKANLNTIRIRT